MSQIVSTSFLLLKVLEVEIIRDWVKTCKLWSWLDFGCLDWLIDWAWWFLISWGMKVFQGSWTSRSFTLSVLIRLRGRSLLLSWVSIHLTRVQVCSMRELNLCKLFTHGMLWIDVVIVIHFFSFLNCRQSISSSFSC